MWQKIAMMLGKRILANKAMQEQNKPEVDYDIQLQTEQPQLTGGIRGMIGG